VVVLAEEGEVLADSAGGEAEAEEQVAVSENFVETCDSIVAVSRQKYWKPRRLVAGLRK